jgi:hypothetical protein
MKCKVAACTKKARGHGLFCEGHWARKRRHGSPTQPTITVAELKPHIRTVAKYVNKLPDSERLWSRLRTAFDHLVRECEQELHYIEQKKVAIRWKREAFRSVVNVAGVVDKDQAILTMLGFGHLLRDQPRRFASDVGAFVQCGRAWRRLSDVNVAFYWHQKEGRQKRVYRDPSYRGAIMLGQMLVDKLAFYGCVIHDKIEKERAREQELKRGVIEALSEGAQVH